MCFYVMFKLGLRTACINEIMQKCIGVLLKSEMLEKGNALQSTITYAGCVD